VPGKSLSELPEVQAAVAALTHQIKERRRRSKKQDEEAVEPAGLSDLAFKLLMLAYDNPYMPVVRMFGRLGKPSAAQQAKIRSELEANNLATFDKVRIGKTNLLLMELMDEACKVLRRQPVHKSGRGNTVHRTICNWICMKLAKRGLSAVLEWLVPGPTQHPVDVAVQVGGKWEVYEVATSTIENLPASIRTCLHSTESISRVTVVFMEKAIRDQQQASILSALAGEPRVGIVRFDTADEYIPLGDIT
jgi:hypothetical protein